MKTSVTFGHYISSRTCGREHICPSVHWWRAPTGWSSALISVMTRLTTFFFLLSGAGLTRGFPVGLTRGGNGTTNHFFCNVQGCAKEVKKLFCNDKLIDDDIHMANCTGALTLNVVCQLDGRAFVSAQGKCEFEGTASQIHTEICTDDNSICRFPSATTSAPAITSAPTTAGGDDPTGPIIGGVLAVLAVVLILCGVYMCVKKKKNNRLQQQAEGQGPQSVPLNGNRSPGEARETVLD